MNVTPYGAGWIVILEYLHESQNQLAFAVETNRLIVAERPVHIVGIPSCQIAAKIVFREQGRGARLPARRSGDGSPEQ
jgi:hypothetical protein